MPIVLLQINPNSKDFKLFSGEGFFDVIERTTDRKRSANEFLIHLIDNFIFKEVLTKLQKIFYIASSNCIL